jgi:hypothetical protein
LFDTYILMISALKKEAPYLSQCLYPYTALYRAAFERRVTFVGPTDHRDRF